MSDPNNTRQDELKNCPLCGKQPKIVYLAGWEIICLCGVNLCLENPGKAPLITAWNTRSGDSGMGDGWRPIESAPMDGTEFQAWCVNGNDGWWEPLCKYDDEGNFFTWGRVDYDIDDWDLLCSPMRATHWQPLTPPPATDASPGCEG